MLISDDRLLPADPATRAIARRLYEAVRHLPIISPHGHTDPRWYAENAPFPDPAGLIVVPDHYIFRMLYSQGVRLEDLGVPTTDGAPQLLLLRLLDAGPAHGDGVGGAGESTAGAHDG